MKHLTEEDLIAYACGNPSGEGLDAAKAHLGECSLCAASVKETRSILEGLERLPIVPPPTFAWSRLQARVQATSQPGRAPEEPRWLALALAHVGAVLAAAALIVASGAWLSSSELWAALAQIPAARALGPTGATALCFFGIGTLASLALTPALWWESRSTSRGK